MPTFSSNAVYIYKHIYVYYENLPYLKNDSDMYYHFIAIMKVLIIENVMMENTAFHG